MVFPVGFVFFVTSEAVEPLPKPFTPFGRNMDIRGMALFVFVMQAKEN